MLGLHESNPASTTTSASEPDWVRCGECGGEYNSAFVRAGLCVKCGESAKRMAEDYDRRLLALFRGEGAVERFSFGRFEPEAGVAKALEAAKAFDAAKDNLYLWGRCGVGKSHLAYAIAREQLMRGAVTLLKPFQLVRQVRGRTPDEEQREVDAMIRARVFILDDLGVERSSDFAQRVLYEVVDGRGLAGRNGLIITSNLSMRDLAAALGEDRLVSRLTGMCRVIEMKGADRRLAAKKARPKE